VLTARTPIAKLEVINRLHNTRKTLHLNLPASPNEPVMIRSCKARKHNFSPWSGYAVPQVALRTCKMLYTTSDAMMPAPHIVRCIFWSITERDQNWFSRTGRQTLRMRSGHGFVVSRCKLMHIAAARQSGDAAGNILVSEQETVATELRRGYHKLSCSKLLHAPRS